MRLAGKNAIITGAAGGIGIETTIQFVLEGANVMMSDINTQALDKAIASVKEYVGAEAAAKVKLAYTVADVADEAQVEALVKAVEPWGGVDVMFNNAGIMHPQDDGLLNTETRIWDLTHSINVKGVFFGCKHAVASMLAHSKTKGSIINTGSMVGVVGSATTQVAYTASKGAVMALTREMAICYAKSGIRFNSLCPGPLNTPLLQEFLDSDEKRIRRTIHLPMGRFGEAIEQAKAVVFLASDDASYVNGTDFMVDGGLSKAYVTAEGAPAAAPQNAVFGR